MCRNLPTCDLHERPCTEIVQLDVSVKRENVNLIGENERCKDDIDRGENVKCEPNKGKG